MPISSTDYKVYILPEATEGVAATSGDRFEFPRTQGNGLLTKDYGVVESTTIRPGRNSNGSRRGNQSVSGSLELNAVTAPLVDYLIESAASAKFVGSILKASDKNVSFTHVAELASNTFKVSTGCRVETLTLQASAAEAVSYSFDIIGMKQDETSTFTGSFTTVTIDDAAYEYLGDEILNIVAAGTTNLKYSTLSLVIGNPLAARNGLSSNAAMGIAATGPRTVTMTLTYWREPGVNYDQIFNGEKQEFTFDLGPAEYGRKFTVYGQANTLEDVEEDDLMVTMTVTGALNSEAGTALTVEKL